MDTWALIIVGMISLVHSIVALIATIAISRDSTLDSIQVIGKLLMCWLLIFVGPLIILKLISEYSPEILPKVARSGPLAYFLFARLNPDFHEHRPESVNGDLSLFGHISDAWEGGEGSCGGGGD